MSRIKGKDTALEVHVRSWLFSQGFRYRKNDRRYPGTPDIVLPKYKTVVFINGCFWHHHEGCKYATIPKTRTDFWLEKFDTNKKNDRKNKQLLETDGWQVIIIWECQLNKRLFEETMLTVKQKIENYNP